MLWDISAVPVPFVIVAISIALLLAGLLAVFLVVRQMLGTGELQNRRKELQSLRQTALRLKKALEDEEQEYDQRIAMARFPEDQEDMAEFFRHENDVLKAKRQVAFNTYYGGSADSKREV